MATPKLATVEHSRLVGESTRLLDLRAHQPLGFSGGQYVIVDSGLTLPSGKAAKRAYSIVSADSEQTWFQLCALRIPDGRCSGFLHELQAGTEVRFSGPWGKFRAHEELSGPVLLMATDTGVTAALSLLQSERFRPHLPNTLFLWLRQSDEYFLTRGLVTDYVPSGCGQVRFGELPPVHHPERLDAARRVVQEVLSERSFAHAFVSGDGVIAYGLIEDFAARGIALEKNDIESFFNTPKKSS